jgi:nuclear pore complex protein Nup188
LDHAASLLYRPKLLKRLTEVSKAHFHEYPDTVLSDPSSDFVSATNSLIEMVVLCAKCLLQFSPKLMNLLCDIEFEQNRWVPFIDVQFGAPKINSNGSPQPTYGTVLSVIALLIKAINLQHFAFKQKPLNKIPSGDTDQFHGNDTVTMMSAADSTNLSPSSNLLSPSSNRRPFAKSLSMSSMSNSIIQPSNELLANLDSKICLSALEFLLTLLASQSLLALRSQSLTSREKQLIRRELSTELHCLHDFIKKKVLKDPTKFHAL